ncbi:cytochrome c [Halomonas sp. I5-271120]|uniref:c-type cytochrome n=1 Tax=Halomonas sp. I5-271120 TaxID=3061632 RepID=UPI002714ADF3|nr:cytochrome c [Halomonas sp. I5-271120]
MHSGMYNVAATDPHLPFVESMMHSTLHASVEAGAEELEVPDLNRDRMIREGASAYDQLCAACHLKPGLESTVLRAGLNPMPPTLSRPTHQSPAQQFWIIKNGIKMTGMPAWGVTHEDQELWEIVAFLRQLPELSQPEYLAMVTPSGPEAGHSAHEGHDHEHGDTSAMATPEPAPSQPQDDGHDHDHGDMSALSEQETTPDPAAAKVTATTELQLATSSKDGTPEQDTSPSSPSGDDHYADGHSH